ncbi:MAG: family 16 glycosylhydrolase [Bacteroidales bacterium]
MKIQLKSNPSKSFAGFLILLALLSLASCSKDKSLPLIDIPDAAFTFDEDVPDGLLKIPVTLSAVTDKEVTLTYSTYDSTAVSGVDYTPKTGVKLTIKPGRKYEYITVKIIVDTANKNDADFNIRLTDPENCILNGSVIKVKIKNTDYSTLAWSDEFAGDALDLGSWTCETGGGGWGNRELEIYTNSTDNVFTEGGFLHIVATEVSSGVYHSARIKTQDKKTFTNCRVDIRALLPQGKGIWPALWMLGNNIPYVSWPGCGEIDIMELLGHEPNKVYGTVHWNDGGYMHTGGFYTLSSGTFSSGFHVFSIIWGPNHIEWLVDNKSYLYVGKGSMSGFPLKLPQFFIFNVAVGGNWPGNPDASTYFPQEMIVDYIRVYQ